MQRVAAGRAMQPRVVFSGIQPTGVPHLGNYAGALRQWARLQDQEPNTRLIYSIVDLHAITVPQPPELLRQRKRETLASILAIGIDPERCTVFYQSSVSLPAEPGFARLLFIRPVPSCFTSDKTDTAQVPEHSELMWILSCTASVGYLSRMTQWKVRRSMPRVMAALQPYN